MRRCVGSGWPRPLDGPRVTMLGRCWAPPCPQPPDAVTTRSVFRLVQISPGAKPPGSSRPWDPSQHWKENSSFPCAYTWKGSTERCGHVPESPSRARGIQTPDSPGWLSPEPVPSTPLCLREVEARPHSHPGAEPGQKDAWSGGDFRRCEAEPWVQGVYRACSGRWVGELGGR